MLKKIDQKTCLILLLMSIVNTANAAPSANANNSQFYYKIGGARSISAPLNAGVINLKIGGSADYGLGFSCGKFNPTLAIRNLLNGFKDIPDDLVNGALSAVNASIGSLPALILQRMNPGLYDLFQNGKLRAEAQLNIANKTCEQMESDIRAGKNPYSGWTDLSKALDWKAQMGTGSYGSSSVDVTEAKATVETNNGDNGIPWLEGVRAGGASQPVIQVTHDIVKAGYNLTLNRNANASSAPTNPTRLREVWSTPTNASQWVVDVLGDSHIRTSDNHATETIPGHGLTPKIQTEVTTISTDLTKIVDGTMDASLSNVVSVSSEDVLVNYDVIQAIRELDPSEQSIAISKLSSEVAMSRVLEKSLFARRMLLTGLREPNVSKTPPAVALGKDAVAVLDQEIENVLYEKRIRTELSSKTAGVILSIKEQRDRQGREDMRANPFDKSLIKEGSAN
jgi:integrating conjugative element protein (TIGR03755 family)